MWYETLLKLFLAILLSGIIGYEREHKNRPAGLRTHVLVCVGAAIVQVTSLEFYGQVMGNYSSDPFRLGAQVISGIGFLGAGTIIKEGNSIKGLTTAASLWAVACIGITVGTGLYKEAVFSTLAVFGSLKFLRMLERWQLKHKRAVALELEILNGKATISQVLQIVTEYNMNIVYMLVKNTDSHVFKIELTLSYNEDVSLSDIIEELAMISGVRNAEFEREGRY
ncbi:MgtC/SapB family protein [uncultured Robinsoniella sp.]|uniref:MgtC/SapB family protein n=1 Tax=uncultured Robinsoniella sp. TaxID=904190 RepID=UPI00374F5D14